MTHIFQEQYLGGAWDPREKENGKLEHQITQLQNKGVHFLWNNDAASSFLELVSMDGDKFIDIDDPDYYFTDAMSDRACEMISKSSNNSNPFFLYHLILSHWPLMPNQKI